LDPQRTPLERVCSQETVTIGPDADVAQAVQLMADNALRRLPVLADNKIVGILSLGDLAAKRDPDSALGEISSAPPNN
jgi:CBS domain-containing protein